MLSTKPSQLLSKKRRVLPIVVFSIILVLVSFIVYAKLTATWPFEAKNQATQDTLDTSLDGNSSVNYDPPTDEDIKASQDGKKSIPDDGSDTSPTHSSHQKKAVSIGVSFADIYDGNVEIRAFTPSVIEGNGTCTATLTQGSHTVTSSTSGFIDSRTTQCSPIFIPVSKFPNKGSWQLIVDYSSPNSSGKSETIEVKL